MPSETEIDQRNRALIAFTLLTGARDSALVIAACGINVLHRGGDGAWRYSISLLTLDTDSKEDR